MRSKASRRRSCAGRRRTSTARGQAIASPAESETGSRTLSSAEILSDWVRRWADLVSTGPLLDIACGAGRHAVFFAERGLEVVAVDREPQLIPQVQFVKADLEAGPWPFPGQ